MPSRRHLVPVAVALGALLPLIGVVGHEFVNFDDDINIARNPYLLRLTWDNVLHFWREAYEQLYVPLTYTVWSLLAAIGRSDAGVQPAAFHAFNLALHVANVLLVFALLRRWLRDDWGAAAGALLFGLHPAQVEPVAWAMGTKDVLSGLFALLAIWLYTAARPDPKRRGWLLVVLAVAAYVLAMLAKPSVVLVPVAAAAIAWGLFDRPGRRVALTTAPWLLLAIPIVVVTARVQPPAEQSLVVAVWQRPLVAGTNLLFYLRALVWPAALAVDYGKSITDMVASPWLPVTGLAPALLLGAVVWRWRDRHWLVAAVVVFVTGLLPALGLLTMRFHYISTVADRFMYLAMIGPAMLAGRVVTAAGGWRVRAAAGGVIGLCAASSFVQSSYWQNSRTLFEHNVQAVSSSWFAHHQLGLALLEKGEKSEAASHFEKAIAIKPDNPLAQAALGQVRMEQGTPEQAIEHMRAAVSMSPGHAPSLQLLGNALAESGKLDEGISYLERAVAAQPDDPVMHNDLGRRLVDRGRHREAAEHLKAALAIDPNSHVVLNNYAMVLARTGDFAGAVDHLERAVAVKPDDSSAWFNLGYAQLRKGDERAAAAAVRRALELRPSWPTAMNKLAWILATTGQPDLADRNEALRLARAACQATNNRSAALLDTLAVAQAATGAFDAAVSTATRALAQAEAANQSEIAAAVRGRLQQYQSRQPFHGPAGY